MTGALVKAKLPALAAEAVVIARRVRGARSARIFRSTYVADFVRERYRDLRVIHGSNAVAVAASALGALRGKVAKQI